MFVSDIMSTCVAECTEDTGLAEVFELIRNCDHGLVVVVDSIAHRVPIGVVTERSICDQIIAKGRNPRNLTAGSVIDPRFKKVRASDLAESIGGDKDLAAVIVVDDNRRVCGLLGRDRINIISSLSKGMAIDAPAMTPQVKPVRPARTSEIPAFGWIQ